MSPDPLLEAVRAGRAADWPTSTLAAAVAAALHTCDLLDLAAVANGTRDRSVAATRFRRAMTDAATALPEPDRIHRYRALLTERYGDLDTLEQERHP